MFSDFVKLLYPDLCFACDSALVKGERVMCTACLVELPTLLNEKNIVDAIHKKFLGKVEIGYSFSYLNYFKGGKVQRLLHKIKYKDAIVLGEFLGKQLGYRIDHDNLDKIDYIVPIPLHPKKLRKRGFNQAEIIGKGLGLSLGVDMDVESLARVKNTDSQTKKGKLDRWKNVKNIFKIDDDSQIKDKHILLVDDVLTTGSTMEAAIHELYDSGKAAKVSIACLAVAE